MGRKNRSAEARQRSRLEANQEVIRAANAPPSEAFGLRRHLVYDSQAYLLDSFRAVRRDGMLLDRVESRRSLHVTLMPRRVVEQQIHRGLVLGFKLGKAAADIEQKVSSAYPGRLVVELGRAAVLKQRYVTMTVQNAALEYEHEVVVGAFEAIGLKGRRRVRDGGSERILPLHISLGDSEQPLSLPLCAEIEEELSYHIPEGTTVELEPIESYPYRQPKYQDSQPDPWCDSIA